MCQAFRFSQISEKTTLVKLFETETEGGDSCKQQEDNKIK